MKSLGNFTVTIEESLGFARASGDYNPLHLDPVAARRTRFGQTVIHGICGTLKALDLFFEQRRIAAALISLKVKYIKPAVQGQNLAAFCDTLGDTTRIEVFADSVRCQIIDLAFADTPDPWGAPHTESRRLAPCSDITDTCMELTVESCKDLSGEVDLMWNQGIMAALFPSATRYLPPVQLAVLLASTRIVGMRCPGLHSVFAQLDLRFLQMNGELETNSDTSLEYKVVTCDPRIDRVELSLRNDMVQGMIEAFFRSPPVNQASFTQLAALVAKAEFSAQHALVIGASRGLGEIIAKALAAGGAKVVMTYAAGREDAIRVSQEIGQHRSHPEVYAYDVLEGTLGLELTNRLASITHIYYLASPNILKSDSGQWEPQLFARYCNYYIDGLSKLLQQITQARTDTQELRLFIPSSIFLEKPAKGFDEYIAAKAAAEVFVRCYANSHRNCTTFVPRLPRLHTDQTAGIKNIDEQQTVNVIIAQLRVAFGDTKTSSISAR